MVFQRDRHLFESGSTPKNSMCLWETAFPNLVKNRPRFLGWSVLGEFFTRNLGAAKPHLRKCAEAHFVAFIQMVRPVLSGLVPIFETNG